MRPNKHLELTSLGTVTLLNTLQTWFYLISLGTLLSIYYALPLAPATSTFYRWRDWSSESFGNFPCYTVYVVQNMFYQWFSYGYYHPLDSILQIFRGLVFNHNDGQALLNMQSRKSQYRCFSGIGFTIHHTSSSLWL